MDRLSGAHEHTPLARVQAWSDVAHGTALFNTLVVFENYDLNSVFRSQRRRTGETRYCASRADEFPHLHRGLCGRTTAVRRGI